MGEHGTGIDAITELLTAMTLNLTWYVVGDDYIGFSDDVLDPIANLTEATDGGPWIATCLLYPLTPVVVSPNDGDSRAATAARALKRLGEMMREPGRDANLYGL